MTVTTETKCHHCGKPLPNGATNCPHCNSITLACLTPEQHEMVVRAVNTKKIPATA